MFVYSSEEESLLVRRLFEAIIKNTRLQRKTVISSEVLVIIYTVSFHYSIVPLTDSGWFVRLVQVQNRI